MNPITFRPCIGEADGLAHRADPDARYYHLRTGTVATIEVLRAAGLGGDCVMPVLPVSHEAHMVADIEAARTKLVRNAGAAKALLTDAAHAHANGRTEVVAEFIERAIELLGTDA